MEKISTIYKTIINEEKTNDGWSASCYVYTMQSHFFLSFDSKPKNTLHKL